MSVNNRQVGGDHYKSTFQHWDFVQFLNLAYIPAQITRYLGRWRKKNGIEDIEKALHYMDKHVQDEMLRHNDALQLLNTFIKENNLQEHEARVFNMLVNYQLGDFDRLYEARNTIKELLAIIKGDSSKPVDPEFQENGDEWRR